MEKGDYVKDIVPNREINGLFAVADAVLDHSRNGPYWKLVLADSSGRVPAKIWSPLSNGIEAINISQIVLVSGRSSIFRNQLQITIEKFSCIDEQENIDPRFFIQSTPYDIDEMFSALKIACLEEFTHAPWRKLVLGVLNNQELQTAFKMCPAAKSVHHAYAGGLLEHTYGVFNVCRSLCGMYPQLDRQTLLAGALFHDLGKIREFSGGIANDYTDEGRLVGHIVMGVQMLAPFLDKSGLEKPLREHLTHLILSHHGQHEFGAPVVPQTAEAFMLHEADLIDARLAQCRGLFPEGKTESPLWSDWQATLERRVFYPEKTPVTCKDRKTGKAGECLSLLKA